MPPPRRPAAHQDPFLSTELLDAEVLDAVVLDAQVLDAEVLDAEVLDAEVLDAEVLDASEVEAEVVDVEPLPLDDEPVATFDLELISGPSPRPSAPEPALPHFRVESGADLLSLDADPPRPATRTASRPATPTRPAVRITFVCPGEVSPFSPGG